MPHVIRIRTASAVLPRRGVWHHAPKKEQRPEAEAPDRCLHRRGGGDVPTRTPALTLASDPRCLRAGALLSRTATAALFELALAALSNALLQLLHVRVELDLILGRQRGAKVIALRLE